MRYQGKIIKWYDEKGFEFIRAAADSKDVFLHISNIRKLNKTPQINDLVTYELINDEKGRFRAVDVAYLLTEQITRKSEKPSSLSYIFLTYIFLFSTFVIDRTLKGFLPLYYIFIYIGSNLVVFLYYYQDKTSAIKKDWRTPESTLHWLSLLGGWGSAYIAQKLFKHKHKKTSFMFIYRLTVLLNCLIIVLYSVPLLLTSLQKQLF